MDPGKYAVVVKGSTGAQFAIPAPKAKTLFSFHLQGIASVLDNAGIFVNIGAKITMQYADEGPFRQMNIRDFLWNYTTEMNNWIKTIRHFGSNGIGNMGFLQNVSSNPQMLR